MTTRKHYSKGKEIKPVDELVAERCEPFEDDVQVNFIMRHKVLKHSVKKAAADVGISESYGYKMNKLWDEHPKFRGRIMKKLDHPNIVRAMDAREVGGVRFLVMEYVDGINLERFITYHLDKELPLVGAGK